MCPAHGRERSPPAIAPERIPISPRRRRLGMRPAQGEDLAAGCAKRADRSGVTRRGVGSLLTSDAERSG